MGNVLMTDTLVERFHLEEVNTELPKVLIKSYDYLFDEDCEYDTYCRGIRETINLEQKRINLFLIGGGCYSKKVEEYYKLWKQMKRRWRLDGFLLGKEGKMKRNDGPPYCGIAEVPEGKLEEAVDILISESHYAFILITDRGRRVVEENPESIFPDIVDYGKYGFAGFNYLKIYQKIVQGDYVLNINYDWEGRILNIGTLQSTGFD